MVFTLCYRYVKLNMVRLVKLKNKNKSFYVKMEIVKEFDIPVGLWIGVEDNIIYSSDELIFI